MATGVRIDCNVEMKTRDGTILRADVYRPDTGEPVPAIIARTPYDKVERRNSNQHLPPAWAAEHGFAVVWQDVRGRHASEGSFSLLSPEVETADGCDAIEWTAEQSWCDGNVGMMGVSYESWLLFSAATAAPKPLKAIAPIGSGHNRPGVLLLSLMVGWAAFTAEDWLTKAGLPEEATAAYAAVLADAQSHQVESSHHLPINEHPLAQIPMMGRALLVTVDEANSGTTSAQEYERVAVPALFTTNYYDDVVAAAIEQYSRIRAGGATRRAREETKLILGPWDHGNLYPSVGQRNFGLYAYGIAGGSFVKQAHLDFFSRHLRGDDAPELPGVKYFVIGANRWATAPAWPPPDSELTPLFLHSSGRANAEQDDGVLSFDPPSIDEPPDRYSYDPADPVPAFGGRHMAITGCPSGPLDQAPIESRPDVLVYTSAPFEDTVDIAGDLSLCLFVNSSAVETDFVAKVCDVDEAGVSLNVADGIVRTKWRNGAGSPAEPLQAGEACELNISLGPLAIQLPAGHRVRLQVSSSAFPYYDRNMNTGNPVGVDATGVVAEQTVIHSAGRPSRLVLPFAQGTAREQHRQ